MRTSQFLAPLFFAATSVAQAVEEGIAPDAAVPEGCRTTVEGKFTIGTLENPALNRRETAQEVCNTNNTNTLLLEDYILTSENRLPMAKFTAPSKTASSTTNTAAPAPSSQTASSSLTARPKQAQSTRAASRYAATTRSP
jgi:hypothetical protein